MTIIPKAEEDPDLLVWVDVETTGLKTDSCQLLEVACLITDTDLNLLDETGDHAVVRYDGDIDFLRANTDAFVEQMHERTGLWDRIASGTPREQVEGELLAYIRQFAPARRQGRLAGNSVRLDLNFLDAHLPAVTEHLHYRSIDVSSVAALAYWWFGSDTWTSKKAAHTAMADIRESLDQLRRLRDRIFTPAGQVA
ncbi:oligoribonuclease [Isoptericola croceus]|uniref:oligoribonuclease n=1 Tax=Isoptericola croceus TaxID=3031406 RepID=UPI0023F6D8BF|nr:oligoribonuclease [Isoptericola croceus]